jgi:ABC-type glycerol-3-phosphate transport system substrate-binding protein
MTKFVRNLGLLGVSGLALSACGGGGGGGSPATPPAAPVVVAPTSFQSQAGAAFAAFFDASPNSEPREPGPGDVPPLNLQGIPIDNN